MPKRITFLAAFVISLSAAATACSGWGRTRTTFPDPDRLMTNRMLVWSAGETHDLHSVRVFESSITGVPWGRGANCIDCQVEIPFAAIDSLRLEQHSGPRTAVALGVAGTIAVIFFGFIGLLAAMR